VDDGILYAPISLAEFTCLRYLKINPVFLVGRNGGENIIGPTPYLDDWEKTIALLLLPLLERLCFLNAQNYFDRLIPG
jgi:hypothetical protein